MKIFRDLGFVEHMGTGIIRILNKYDKSVFVFSPNFIKHLMIYFRYGRITPYYMLSCSAFTANDFNLFGAFVDRCYKWAYFTKVQEIDIESVLARKRQNRKIPTPL